MHNASLGTNAVQQHRPYFMEPAHIACVIIPTLLVPTCQTTLMQLRHQFSVQQRSVTVRISIHTPPNTHPDARHNNFCTINTANTNPPPASSRVCALSQSSIRVHNNNTPRLGLPVVCQDPRQYEKTKKYERVCAATSPVATALPPPASHSAKKKQGVTQIPRLAFSTWYAHVKPANGAAIPLPVSPT